MIKRLLCSQMGAVWIRQQGAKSKIVDVGGEGETYDDALNSILSRAMSKRSEVFELALDCLWVYANADPATNGAIAAARCVELLTQQQLKGLHSNASARPAWDRDRLVSLNWGFFQPMAALIWLTPIVPDADAAADLAKLFGLTLAERRLVSRLILGKDLRQAAKSLHISLHTARTQLKSIFDKTGRRTQAALLALAMRLAALRAPGP